MFSRIRLYLFLAGLAGLSILGYLITSYLYYRSGFPLDDAWIHQTYARNLASSGEWAFYPGTPSAGSTAPMWSGILALGYFLGIKPYVWTYLMGWIFLYGISIVGMQFFYNFSLGNVKYVLWSGILLAFEWHLVWASASGMETIAFAFFITLVFSLLIRENINWLVLGLLIGCSVWLRPDGVTLIAPALLCLNLLPMSRRERWLAIGKLVIGVSLLTIPYLVFNYSISGNWWPNTFIAKQKEYAVLRQIPFINRWFSQASLPLIGVGVLVFPGFFLCVAQAVRRRSWVALSILLWIMGYTSLYAWRLPVTYQHGRYVMPVIQRVVGHALRFRGLADYQRACVQRAAEPFELAGVLAAEAVYVLQDLHQQAKVLLLRGYVEARMEIHQDIEVVVLESLDGPREQLTSHYPFTLRSDRFGLSLV